MNVPLSPLTVKISPGGRELKAGCHDRISALMRLLPEIRRSQGVLDDDLCCAQPAKISVPNRVARRKNVVIMLATGCRLK